MRAPPLPMPTSSSSFQAFTTGRLEDFMEDFIQQNIYNRYEPEDSECFCGQKYSSCSANHSCPAVNYAVVGGNFVEPNEFPWAALLNLSSSENGRTNRCGGSLVSDRFSYLNVSRIIDMVVEAPAELSYVQLAPVQQRWTGEEVCLSSRPLLQLMTPTCSTTTTSFSVTR